MGVDLKCKLNPETKIEDVGHAIASLVGHKPQKEIFGSNKEYWKSSQKGNYAFSFYLPIENFDKVAVSDSKNVQIITENDSFNAPSIIFKDLLGDERHVMYFMENDDGSKMIIPRSTPFWIAVSKKLIKIFGGTLLYTDVSEKDFDLCIEKGKINKIHYDGDNEKYEERNKILFNIKALTTQDYLNANIHAAYKIDNNSDAKKYWDRFLNATTAYHENLSLTKNTNKRKAKIKFL